MLRVENLLETSILGLKLMLGLPRTREVRLQGELGYKQVQLELVALLQSSLNNRSELLQLKMEKQKIDNLLKITWAQYVPNFSLVAATATNPITSICARTTGTTTTPSRWA